MCGGVDVSIWSGGGGPVGRGGGGVTSRSLCRLGIGVRGGVFMAGGLLAGL